MFSPVTLFLAQTGQEQHDAVPHVLQFFKDGGVFMVLLALSSVVTVTAIVFKILSLRRRNVIPGELERQVEDFGTLVRQGNVDPVLKQFETGQSILARLCGIAVEYRGRPRPDIVEAVQASAREEMVKLNSGMVILDTIITVAPLFGLLGTASGLVVIFQGLGIGDTTDQSLIARGIGRALDNTIVGLAIAVPAVVAHSWFSRRIEVLSSRLETLLGNFARVCEAAAPPAGPRGNSTTTPPGQP
ncbi:MAG: biopolymer transport protein ExbB [Akkermansiaceae bacterium]|nr:biopolymer transport protein ExbB [Akkermansiaceae bacterium]